MRSPTVILVLSSVIAISALPVLAADVPSRVGYAEMSRQAEAAIDRGLRYLESCQNPDGSWGSSYKVAETATALMSFMVKGHFPGRGPYGAKLDPAVAFMITRSREKGGFLGGVNMGMYEHGLGTLALSEVWGESDNDELREAVKKAVEVIKRSQAPNGGWRDAPQPNDADLSVTVMQIMALASAKEAGCHVPDEVMQKAVAYVRSCQHTLGGFCYQPGTPPGLARTAAGVMSLYMTDREGNAEAIRRGLDYIIKADSSKFQQTSWYYYFHYYAVQAMYQSGESNYQSWYPKIRDALLSRQHADGSFGSPESGASQAFTTSISLLILGVPYRYLPIYQR